MVNIIQNGLENVLSINDLSGIMKHVTYVRALINRSIQIPESTIYRKALLITKKHLEKYAPRRLLESFFSQRGGGRLLEARVVTKPI